ncbi:MAG TPA: C39 family peptidase [Candidatus Magasanikbacteria bacterium]|nr:C39 family peptidase [Candidatus Magasanikbacteria bacterium]
MKLVACLTLAIIYLFSPHITRAVTRIDVPFIRQAPDGIWREPWLNACEETSIAMVKNYYAGNSNFDAKTEILRIINARKLTVGNTLDESADTIAEIINDYAPFEAEKITDPTLEQIQAELSSGRPVIITADGKALKNPYFLNNGPRYHALVLTGYDEATNEFISNDPGTRRGLDFRYKYDTIMTAMRDLAPDLTSAPSVAIFTREMSAETAESDADSDGLDKQSEITTGTRLDLADSDNDGYYDGAEVSNGYSPTLNESSLKTGSLIKTVADPKIYLKSGKTKKHVTSEKAFINHGYKWKNVITVSESYINSLTDGADIN